MEPVRSKLQIIVKILENGDFQIQLFGYGALMYYLSKYLSNFNSQFINNRRLLFQLRLK